MMTLQRVSQVLTCVMVFVMITSVAVPFVSVGSAEPGTVADGQGEYQSEIVTSQSTINDEVSIWEKAPFPLRVNTVDAATTVEAPTTFVNAPEVSSGDAALNKDLITVFNASEEIPIEFQSRSGVDADVSQYAGDNVTIVLARSKTQEAFGLTSAISLGSNPTSEDANDDFEYSIAGTDTLDGDGSGSFAVSPSTPGTYAILLVDTESGSVSVENGNLSATDSPQVIGVDVTGVQDTTANITSSPERVSPGDQINVSLESNLDAAEGDVSHTVLLVNESDVTRRQLTATIDGDVDQDVPGENVSLSSDVASVRGARDVAGNPVLIGSSFDSDQLSGTFSTESLVQFIDSQLAGDGPTFEENGSAVLDASITAVDNQGPATNLSVRTLPETETGSYTLVYVASNERTTEYSTTTEPVEIALPPASVTAQNRTVESGASQVIIGSARFEGGNFQVRVEDGDGNSLGTSDVFQSGRQTGIPVSVGEGSLPDAGNSTELTAVLLNGSDNEVTRDGSRVTTTFTVETSDATSGGPAFFADTTPIGFGQVGVGDTATQTVEIANRGDSTLRVTANTGGADADNFSIVSQENLRIQPGNSETVRVQFNPDTADELSGSLELNSNDDDAETVTISLSGVGVSPQLELNRSLVLFDGADVGSGSSTQTVQINNTGNEDVELSLSVAGTNQGAFSVSTSQLVVEAAESETVDLTFAPQTAGELGARLQIAAESEDTVATRVVRIGGIGRAAAIDTGRTTVDFGDVLRGGSEANRTAQLAVTNNGTAPLDVSPSVTTGGSTFTLVDSSNRTIQPGATEVLQVRVSPTSDGSVSGELTLDTDADVRDPVVSLSANAVSPTFSTSTDLTSNIQLGEFAVGSRVTSEVTVENTGDAPLEIEIENGEIDTTIQPGEAEALEFGVTVDSESANTATTDLTTNDPDQSSVSVTVEATGVTSQLSFTEDTLQFGSVPRGTSTTQTITVENTGNQEVSIGTAEIQDSSQFSVIQSSVPDSLGAGETSSVRVQLNAGNEVGGEAGTLRLVETTGSGDVNVTAEVTTTVVGPTAEVQGVARAGVVDVTSSSTETITVDVSNVGPSGTVLGITDVTTPSGSAFTPQQTAATVVAGETVNLPVEFTPSSADEFETTVTLTTDAPDQPIQTVTVTGIGGAPNATVSEAPTFGDVSIGEQQTETVTLTNEGGFELNIDSVETNGDTFSVSGVPDTLVPGQTATLRVTAAPSASGSLQETLTVVTDDTDGDETLTLQATGTAPTAALDTTGAVDFGDVGIGSAGTTTVEISNTGNANLRLSQPAITGDNGYSIVSGDSSATVAPGETTTYTVVFAPETEDSLSGTFEVEANDPNQGVVTVDLSGTGIAGTASITPQAVSFGAIDPSTTETETVTFENTGEGDLTVQQVSLAGGDTGAFTVTNQPSTGTVLASGETAEITVEVSSSLRGSLSTQLQVTTDQETIAASLGATVTAPDASVATGEVQFGETRLGDTQTQTVTISNQGNAPLDVTSLAASSSEFTIVDGPEIVEAQDSATVAVAFTPNEGANAVDDAITGTTQTGQLTVQTNDTSVTRQLRGTGITPDVRVSQKGVRYGIQNVGDSASRSLTIRNDINGTAPVEITNAVFTGRSASEFSIQRGTSLRGTVLAPGESTTVPVVFNPQRAGTKFATLRLLTNDTRTGASIVSVTNANTIIEVTFGSVTVDYVDPDPGLQSTVDISRNIDRDVTFETLTTAADTSNDFSVTLDSDDAPFSGQSQLSENDLATLRYIEISNAPPDFTNATIEFGVEKAALDNVDSGRNDVTVRVEGSSGYQSQQTTFVRETAQTFVYEVTLQDDDAQVAVAAQVPTEDDGDDGGGGGGGGGNIQPPVANLTAPANSTVGDEVTLDASNSTDNAGIIEYEFDVDGDGTFEVSQTEPVLTTTIETAGTVNVSVRVGDRADLTDTASRNVTVAEAADDDDGADDDGGGGGGGGGGGEGVFPDAVFEVTDAQLSQTQVTPGTSIAVSAIINNTGGSPDVATINTTVNGTVVDSQEVTLNAGQQTNVTSLVTFNQTGNFTVQVGNTTVGNVSVVETITTPTATPTETETESPTPTETETESPTPTETETETESPTPTETETETESPTPTETETESPTATATETATPTETSTRFPGFGPLVALLALIALGAIALRRREE